MIVKKIKTWFRALGEEMARREQDEFNNLTRAKVDASHRRSDLCLKNLGMSFKKWTQFKKPVNADGSEVLPISVHGKMGAHDQLKIRALINEYSR